MYQCDDMIRCCSFFCLVMVLDFFGPSMLFIFTFPGCLLLAHSSIAGKAIETMVFSEVVSSFISFRLLPNPQWLFVRPGQNQTSSSME